MSHFVYILYSEKLDKFYTGETSDFDVRLVFHENSLPTKYIGKARD